MTQSLKDLMPLKKCAGVNERWRERERESLGVGERERDYFLIVLCNLHANHSEKAPHQEKSTQYR